MMLAQTACSVRWINESILEAHEESELTTFYRSLSYLLRCRMASICAGSADEGAPLAMLIPTSPYFKHKWATIQVDQCYRMSRFAYIRRDEDGYNYLESPLSHARIRLEHTLAANLIYQLGKAVTPLELTQTLPAEDRENVTSLLALLVMGDFASLTTPEGQLITENDEAFLYWDFHDLLFHSRSRIGRHDNALGGTYRFPPQILPQPAIKQTEWPVTIPLFRPDMNKLRMVDPGLTAVLEKRTSIYDYGDNPITVAQLGEFLYRVARVNEVYSGGETGEFTKRPYPSAGASYEMEFYLTIEQCEGLAPGFYWYNPLDHTLSFVHEANKNTKRLLSDANQAMRVSGRPQVLIILAARFQRVSWKYQSLAYSLILKNVGVIYATMYLVATAMNLAPCALGMGDSDLFLKLSGTDYLKETSVGEFMLGSKSTQIE
jgi:SagB-type dehydrogenase family enzyme